MAPHCVGVLALITGNKQRLAGNPSLQRPPIKHRLPSGPFARLAD
jgi:hypothetical protein